jgi:hypothetical protein
MVLVYGHNAHFSRLIVLATHVCSVSLEEALLLDVTLFRGHSF